MAEANSVPKKFKFSPVEEKLFKEAEALEECLRAYDIVLSMAVFSSKTIDKEDKTWKNALASLTGALKTLIRLCETYQVHQIRDHMMNSGLRLENMKLVCNGHPDIARKIYPYTHAMTEHLCAIEDLMEERRKLKKEERRARKKARQAKMNS